jgi:hypothetical protein
MHLANACSLSLKSNSSFAHLWGEINSEYKKRGQNVKRALGDAAQFMLQRIIILNLTTGIHSTGWMTIISISDL